MGSEQDAVKGDLDRVADEPDADCGIHESVANPVAGTGEVDRSVFVDDPQYLCALSRLGWTRDLRTPIHLVVVVDQVTTGVGRDHGAVV